MKGKPNKKSWRVLANVFNEKMLNTFFWICLDSGGGHCRFKSKRQASPTLIKMWYRIVSQVKHPKVTLLNSKKHLQPTKKIQKEHRKLAWILAPHLFWQIPGSINEFLPHDQSTAHDFCSSKLRGRWTTYGRHARTPQRRICANLCSRLVVLKKMVLSKKVETRT